MGQGLGCKAGAQLWVDQTVGKKSSAISSCGGGVLPFAFILPSCRVFGEQVDGTVTPSVLSPPEDHSGG